MLNTKLQSFLDESNIHYDVIKHSPAYTAEEIAASAHVPAKELAKTVIVKIDGKLAMVIEPANIKVDLEALQKWTGAKDVILANERDFKSAFPECETGAMPPFGNLYDLDVYEDERFGKRFSADGNILFNAGNHSELIKMNYKDFERLVRPTHLPLD